MIMILNLKVKKLQNITIQFISQTKLHTDLKKSIALKSKTYEINNQNKNKKLLNIKAHRS